MEQIQTQFLVNTCIITEVGLYHLIGSLDVTSYWKVKYQIVSTSYAAATIRTYLARTDSKNL